MNANPNAGAHPKRRARAASVVAGIIAACIAPAQSPAVAQSDDRLPADVQALAANCTTPPPGMVAWWPFDTEEHYFDLAGFRNEAEPVNTTPVAIGRVGRALAFNGASSRIEVPDHPELDVGLSDFTIDAWVMLRSGTTGNRGVRPIVDKRTYGATDVPYGYSFFVRDGRLGFSMAAPGGTPSISVLADSRDALRTNQWQLAAVTIDRDSRTGGKLYLNGSIIANFDPTRVVKTALDTHQPLVIGGHNPLSRRTTSRTYFYGWLDEVEVFKRALSKQELDKIYVAGNSGKCRPAAPEVKIEACNPNIQKYGACDDIEKHGMTELVNLDATNVCSDPAVGFQFHLDAFTSNIPVDSVSYPFQTTFEQGCDGLNAICNPFTPPAASPAYVYDPTGLDGAIDLVWRSDPQNTRPIGLPAAGGNVVAPGEGRHFGYTVQYGATHTPGHTYRPSWLTAAAMPAGMPSACDLPAMSVLWQKLGGFAVMAEPSTGFDRLGGIDCTLAAATLRFRMEQDNPSPSEVRVGYLASAAQFKLADLVTTSRLFGTITWLPDVVRLAPGEALTQDIPIDWDTHWGAVVVTEWRNTGDNPSAPPRMRAFHGLPLVPLRVITSSGGGTPVPPALPSPVP